MNLLRALFTRNLLMSGVAIVRYIPRAFRVKPVDGNLFFTDEKRQEYRRRVERFVEIFLVHSWAEHLRQHERQTKADREVEQRVYSYVAGEPKVRHLLYADSTKP
jgi:hypothetical protein